MTPEVGEHLKAADVEIRPYDGVWADLATAAKCGKRVWANPAKVSQAIFDAVEEAQARRRRPQRPLNPSERL